MGPHEPTSDEEDFDQEPLDAIMGRWLGIGRKRRRRQWVSQTDTDSPLKLFTVSIVDKGKTLYECSK
ncbi:MAG: hypothetical protein ACRC2B_06820 [Rubrivivax sp.]